MAKILVTGVGGFVGQHLVHELSSCGHSVYGVGMGPIHADTKSKLVDYLTCDLTKAEDVGRINFIDIDGVINLAGLAAVGPSFSNAEEYIDVNVRVHEIILKRLVEIGKTDARILSVSSGAVYDNNQKMPLTEISVTTPASSPYAQSKLAMEDMLSGYIDKGLDIVIARPFNHIGPGQQAGFLLPDLATQALGASEIRVGNLKTARDYTDVRDVVKAYTALTTSKKLKSRLYNVCSGKSARGEEILKCILEQSGQQNLPVHVDKTKIRPTDAMEIIGSHDRITDDTGWLPTINLEQTIRDYLAWRKEENS